MNSKQRVQCAFAHQEADRVPVSELYINSPVASALLGRTALTGWSGKIRCKIMGDMLIDGKAKEFYRQEAVDLVDVYEKCELDTVLIERPPLKDVVVPKKIDARSYYYDYGNGVYSTIVYDEKTDLFHSIDSNFHRGGLEEFARYVSLLEKSEIDLDEWDFSQAQYIMDRCGKEKYVMALVEIDFPPMSMGAIGGLFLEAMAFEPELCERYLDYRVRKGLKFIDYYAKLGVDCIFDGEDLAGNTGPMFSKATYMQMYASRFKQFSARLKAYGMKYLRHTDGNIMLFADEFLLESGFDGYQSIDPIAGMDRKIIKQKYGDRILLMGNVDCGKILHYGTAEDVARETVRVIQDLSPGGGHILSSSNTIHSGVPVENFLTMLKTARASGTYPIKL